MTTFLKFQSSHLDETNISNLIRLDAVITDAVDNLSQAI